MTSQAVRQVDQTGLKVGQAATILLLVLAFILNLPWLVLLVGIAQLLGALDVPYAPYRLLYQRAIKPSGIARPHIVPDNPEPHRFAMLIGALFNGAAALLIYTGTASIGWLLVWIVIALANLNFWLNFCAGCWMYYQFNRLGVPGFTQARVR
jgi:hypothetical protein